MNSLTLDVIVILSGFGVIYIILFITIAKLRNNIKELTKKYNTSVYHVTQLQQFVKFVDNYDEVVLKESHPDDIKHANRARKQFREMLDRYDICLIQPELKLALNNTSKISTVED